MRKCALMFGLILGLGVPPIASASRPVKVTFTGCVFNGVLISEKIDFGDHAVEGTLHKIRCLGQDNKPIDMGRFEGKRITIGGLLLPGDRFYAEEASIKVLGERKVRVPEKQARKLSLEEQKAVAQDLLLLLALADESDVEKTIGLHTRIMEECPDTESAELSVWSLALTHINKRNDIPKGIELLEYFLSRYPRANFVRSAREELLDAYAKNGSAQKAVAFCEETFRENPELLKGPDDIGLLIKYAKLLATTGNTEKAMNTYQRILGMEGAMDWQKEAAKTELGKLQGGNAR